ncbi:MAG TPA: sensor histidine kinase, partial [Chiayiivirga sp.]|nr:sensor histidine kinase [Chiayiivirga sp.]
VGHIARDALTQVRGAVSGIRAAGIAAELASARLLLETDGVAFDYRLDAAFSGAGLPADVENALAMTVREAATNIQRHAQARQVEVHLGVEGEVAVLRVIDDGRGGALRSGNGLAGMRERLEAVGGTLRIDSRPGAGTRIEARIPLARKSDALAPLLAGERAGVRGALAP